MVCAMTGRKIDERSIPQRRVLISRVVAIGLFERGLIFSC
jgi:hypothetical protein